MSEKRRDKRKRILRTGEDQRSDGRYRYSYIDALGIRRTVYSWRLEPTDPVPTGKRPGLSLREIEKIVEKELENAKEGKRDCTVSELVIKYTTMKKGVRKNTRTGYKTVINLLSKDEFGSRSIHEIKVSDAKLFLIGLQENGKSYSSIHSIRGVLRPAFQMAVEDEVLAKNPFEFHLADTILNDSVKREALTPAQERSFLNFIKNDRHFCRYYDGIFVLFNTGLRISEFCGLTLSDLDFKERAIHVNHQLVRFPDMEYHMQVTKTDSGLRTLPMSDEVYEAFQRIVRNRKTMKVEPIIDGHTGFLFFDKNGNPRVALHWEKYFEHICDKYNSIYKVQMPNVTPHVARHTYCTRMATSGISPKTLQYLMGHSDIATTLNVYTHLGYDDAKSEVRKIKKA